MTDIYITTLLQQHLYIYVQNGRTLTFFFNVHGVWVYHAYHHDHLATINVCLLQPDGTLIQ